MVNFVNSQYKRKKKCDHKKEEFSPVKPISYEIVYSFNISPVKLTGAPVKLTGAQKVNKNTGHIL